jgi:flagellin-specific chaperone FliS
MEFKLNPYHRNIPDVELLQDIQRVASLLNQKHLTKSEYNKNGSFDSETISRRFAGWLNACAKAELSHIKCQKTKKLTDKEVITDIQRVANLLKRQTITTGDYRKYGNYDCSSVLKIYKTWNKALEVANLEKSSNRNTMNEEMFIEIERIWRELGHQPTSTDIKNGASIYSLHMYATRFGGWRGALDAFVKYINDDIQNEQNTFLNIESQHFIEPIIGKATFNHKTNREPNWRLRFRVLKRDNFKCCACGASPAKDPSVNLHIDHIHPWSKGGESVIDNLQTLCDVCNLGKSDV